MKDEKPIEFLESWVDIYSKDCCRGSSMVSREISIFLCVIFRVTPMAYGGSQARGPIRDTTAGLCHSYGNGGFLTHWARPGIKPITS